MYLFIQAPMRSVLDRSLLTTSTGDFHVKRADCNRELMIALSRTSPGPCPDIRLLECLPPRCRFFVGEFLKQIRGSANSAGYDDQVFSYVRCFIDTAFYISTLCRLQFQPQVLSVYATCSSASSLQLCQWFRLCQPTSRT